MMSPTPETGSSGSVNGSDNTTPTTIMKPLLVPTRSSGSITDSIGRHSSDSSTCSNSSRMGTITPSYGGGSRSTSPVNNNNSNNNNSNDMKYNKLASNSQHNDSVAFYKVTVCLLLLVATVLPIHRSMMKMSMYNRDDIGDGENEHRHTAFHFRSKDNSTTTNDEMTTAYLLEELIPTAKVTNPSGDDNATSTRNYLFGVSSTEIFMQSIPGLKEQHKAFVAKQQLEKEQSDGDSTTTLATTADQDCKETAYYHADGKTQPKLIIHVGPLKTGTTTVQAMLGKLHREKFLAKDNWFNPLFPLNTTFIQPIHTPSLLGDQKVQYEEMYYELPQSRMLEDLIYLNKPSDHFDDVFFEHLLDDMNIYKNAGVNVVVTSEWYSVRLSDPWYYKKLRTVLCDWDIRIVAGYRPFYDYYRSLWSQSNKHMNTDEYIAKPWTDEHTGELAQIVTPFDTTNGWIENELLFTDAIVDYTSPYFPVDILDMQYPSEKGGFLLHHVCDILQATTSCEAYRDMVSRGQGVESRNKSPIEQIRCDSVLLVAAARGMIDMEKYERYDIMIAMEKFLNDKLNMKAADLPMDCDIQDKTDAKQVMWETTLFVEKNYVPEKLATDPNRTAVLKEGFQDVITRNLFCIPDANAILSDEKYLAFFRQYAKNNGDTNNNKKANKKPAAGVDGGKSNGGGVRGVLGGGGGDKDKNNNRNQQQPPQNNNENKNQQQQQKNDHQEKKTENNKKDAKTE